MKKLENFKNEKLEVKNLFNVLGGLESPDGTTSYRTSSGRSGKDCYSDDDGDGNLSDGDGVRLDTGEWYTYH